MKRKLWHIIGSVIGVLILLFMIKRFLSVYNKIEWGNINFSIPIIVVSIFVFVSAYFVDVFAWRKILSKLGVKVPYFRCFVVLALSNMGKYIPGKIFTVIGRVGVDLNRKREVVFSVFIEMFFLALSSFIISISLISYMWKIDMYILVSIVIVSLFMVHPRIINFVLKYILKKDECLWYGTIFDNILLLIMYIISWLIKGLSFYLMVRAFVSIYNMWYIISVFPLSWMIGFFAIIVPGGIGVREGIMSIALSRIIDDSVSIGLSLFSRLWIMMIEILSLIISFGILSLRKDKIWE